MSEYLRPVEGQGALSKYLRAVRKPGVSEYLRPVEGRGVSKDLGALMRKPGPVEVFKACVGVFKASSCLHCSNTPHMMWCRSRRLELTL